MRLNPHRAAYAKCCWQRRAEHQKRPEGRRTRGQSSGARPAGARVRHQPKNTWPRWQTWKNERACFTTHEHDEDHPHSHDHSHDHDKHHHHEHHHSTEEIIFEELGSCSDPHELAHAKDIKKRFSNKEVTNGQILLFGLTGGLIPCPASITVLLICLQLKQFTLGVALVLAFSVGLALTLVASGVIAALSMRHLSKRWNGFGEFAKKAPYFSGGLILLVGLYIGYQGLHHFF